jgi:hypothetical protein
MAKVLYSFLKTKVCDDFLLMHIVEEFADRFIDFYVDTLCLVYLFFKNTIVLVYYLISIRDNIVWSFSDA